MSSSLSSQSFDIIFAGGGTSACVAASRLLQADPTLTILIIERGKNNLNDPTITTPAICFVHLLPTSQNTVFYRAESEPALNGHRRYVATGGTLGGGGSINSMMYTRAQGIDFDSFNMEGWDSETLIEYARKVETVHLDDPLLDESVHGFSGPLEISFGTYAPKRPQDDFLAAAQSYGFPEIHDLQDFTSNNGFTRSAKYISLDGTRQSAAHRYLQPLLDSPSYPNLHILTESKVRRIIFEDNHAIGIEYEPETTFLPLSHGVTERIAKTVKAKKLVVVSAGAFGTPLILERSGIGNKDLLADLDIPIISDLPDVGENYQDHHVLPVPYKTHLKPEETLDGLRAGRLDFVKAYAERDPLLGWNGLDIGGKLRMTDEEAADLGPEFKAAWEKDFAESPTKPIMLMGVGSCFFGNHKTLDHGSDGVAQYATMASYTPYPYSRGSIHITSPDANMAPKFITGYLADKNDIDLKKQVWAYKKGRDIYRRTNAFAGELAIGHPRFKDGSRAALTDGSLKKEVGEWKSVDERKVIAPVEYDEDDDRAIEEFVRERVQTAWHSLGTCKMAPREDGGVVDQHLNVYGTTGLKCVDLSVIPKNVAANTYNMALIVGEKAADIINKELALMPDHLSRVRSKI